MDIKMIKIKSSKDWDGKFSDITADVVLSSYIENSKKDRCPIPNLMGLYEICPIASLTYLFKVASILMYKSEELVECEYVYTFDFIKGRIIKIKNKEDLYLIIPLFKTREDLLKVCSYYHYLLEVYKPYKEVPKDTAQTSTKETFKKESDENFDPIDMLEKVLKNILDSEKEIKHS